MCLDAAAGVSIVDLVRQADEAADRPGTLTNPLSVRASVHGDTAVVAGVGGADAGQFGDEGGLQGPSAPVPSAPAQVWGNRPPDAPGQGDRSGRSGRMRVEIVADQFAPSSVRHHLRQWLSELRWPPDAVDDLLLAVSEAVSNVVDHAYPPDRHGPVLINAVHLEHHDQHHHGGHQGTGEKPGRVDQVVVTVADRGSWRRIPTVAGNRGRGLTMMRATAQTLDIDARATGTRVTLTSNPTHLH